MRDIARNFTYNYVAQDYPSKTGVGMDVRLFYTDANQVDPMNFYQYGTSKYLNIDPGIPGYMVWIRVNNVNQIQVSCGNTSNFRNVAQINTGNQDNYTNPYLVNYPINYPAGYEGITPPSEIVEALHLKPEWTFISSAQWQGRFMDTNVATYDGISELYTVCDDDLAPVIVGNISNGSGWIQEFTISATAQVEVTLPESTNPQTFTITGRYDCGGFGPEFDTDGVYTFDINQYGTVNNAFMENCVDMDLLGQFNPDGLDIPQCIENIQNIIGLLSFGQLKLNKNFENIDSIECRNLQVIGGWMFKPGAYICPQIPANIRNIITPFILLALGYLAANFLRKRNESI